MVGKNKFIHSTQNIASTDDTHILGHIKTYATKEKRQSDEGGNIIKRMKTDQGLNTDQ